MFKYVEKVKLNVLIQSLGNIIGIQTYPVRKSLFLTLCKEGMYINPIYQRNQEKTDSISICISYIGIKICNYAQRGTQMFNEYFLGSEEKW